jgi:hypothetical protein
MGNLSTPGHRPWLNTAYQRPIRTYICPSDPSLPPGGMGTIQVATWIDSMALTSYAANAQVFGQVDTSTGTLLNWQGQGRLPNTIPDGLSNTIMFGERYGLCGYYMNVPTNGLGGTAWDWWGFDSDQPAFAISFAPYAIGPTSKFQHRPSTMDPLQCDVFLASTPHTSGMQVCLADGSVRTISAQITPDTWWAACTPYGGEKLGPDW